MVAPHPPLWTVPPMVWEENMKKFIAIIDSGLYIDIDDSLSPEEVLDLMQQLKNGLFDWAELTGRKIGGEKPK